MLYRNESFKTTSNWLYVKIGAFLKAGALLIFLCVKPFTCAGKGFFSMKDSCLFFANRNCIFWNQPESYDVIIQILEKDKGDQKSMKKRSNMKPLSSILCMMLIMAMALFTVGCNSNSNSDGATATESATVSADSNVLGEGQTAFTFTVVDKDGNETEFEIHTDKETVGEALLEQNLIAGEDGEYGLYVKTVNGITADYDTDGVYWAFYVNGEYASSGVDTTPVTEGDNYSFKIEK